MVPKAFAIEQIHIDHTSIRDQYGLGAYLRYILSANESNEARPELHLSFKTLHFKTFLQSDVALFACHQRKAHSSAESLYFHMIRCRLDSVNDWPVGCQMQVDRPPERSWKRAALV